MARIDVSTVRAAQKAERMRVEQSKAEAARRKAQDERHHKADVARRRKLAADQAEVERNKPATIYDYLKQFPKGRELLQHYGSTVDEVARAMGIRAMSENLARITERNLRRAEDQQAERAVDPLRPPEPAMTPEQIAELPEKRSLRFIREFREELRERQTAEEDAKYPTVLEARLSNSARGVLDSDPAYRPLLMRAAAVAAAEVPLSQLGTITRGHVDALVEGDEWTALQENAVNDDDINGDEDADHRTPEERAADEADFAKFKAERAAQATADDSDELETPVAEEGDE